MAAGAQINGTSLQYILLYLMLQAETDKLHVFTIQSFLSAAGGRH